MTDGGGMDSLGLIGDTGEYLPQPGPAVPIGGARVPEGMEGPSEVPPPAPVDTDSLPAEYHDTVKLRDQLGVLKKMIASVNSTAEGVIRIREKGGAADALASEAAKLRAALDELVGMRPIFEGSAMEQYAGTIDLVVETLSKPDLERPALTEYNLEIRKHTSLVFNHQRQLLARLKEIKKEAAAV